MNANFPRVLTLLRKEKGLSQKKAAQELGVSQALLSHYEKGIRECGLDFLVRCADFYDVSCDFLLGRSLDRTGTTLTVDDIPEPDAAGKENILRGSILPTLNKKLLANSLNILYDLLQKSGNKTLINEISGFLMLSIYKMYRIVYASNPNNQAGLFTVDDHLASYYAGAAMNICEANAKASTEGFKNDSIEPLTDPSCFAMTTEYLSEHYPLFASSLLNLIQNSETRILGKSSKKAGR